MHGLTPFELSAMLEGWEERRQRRLWEKAYWTANLMSLQTKRPVQPKTLMKPFLPKKDTEEIKAERDRIMEEFGMKGGT